MAKDKKTEETVETAPVETGGFADHQCGTEDAQPLPTEPKEKMMKRDDA